MGLVVRQPLREQVREWILQRVGRGEYAAGRRLVESKLAEELGISTVPVREAIRELVAIGVLGFAPHKGAWVREVSPKETIEALEVRSALEPLAARLAGAGMRGRCRALRRASRAIVAAARVRDFVGFQEHNQAFHRMIVEAAGNAALLRTWTSLALEVRTRFIMDFLASEDAVAIALEHERIVDAFEADDAARGAALLAAHSNNLVAYLNRQWGAMGAAAGGSELSESRARKRGRGTAPCTAKPENKGNRL